MVVEVTGSPAPVEVVSPAEWTGAAFLADQWALDDRKIHNRLGYKPARDPAEVRETLQKAINRTWQQIVTQSR
jgi:hypothetical protein